MLQQWHVSMEMIDDGQSLLCTVARGQTSYLYFQTFTLTLSGPGVTLQQFEAIVSLFFCVQLSSSSCLKAASCLLSFNLLTWRFLFRITIVTLNHE